MQGYKKNSIKAKSKPKEETPLYFNGFSKMQKILALSGAVLFGIDALCAAYWAEYRVVMHMMPLWSCSKLYDRPTAQPEPDSSNKESGDS